MLHINPDPLQERYYAIPIVHRLTLSASLWHDQITHPLSTRWKVAYPLEHLDLAVGVSLKHLLHFLPLRQLEDIVLFHHLVRERRRRLVSGGHCVLQLLRASASVPHGLVGIELRPSGTHLFDLDIHLAHTLSARMYIVCPS